MHLGRRKRHSISSQGAWVLALLLVYSAGLTHDLTESWVGMHDWNGAFFSQLARNMLRYPFDLHHGMPCVAVGQELAPAAERSVYATHPPGLTWVLAAGFRLFGESEAIARLVPIATSLSSLVLLVWIVGCAYDRRAGLLAGLIYSVMPMAVYFGRMVDHESVCLFFMLAAVASWSAYAKDLSTKRRQRIALAGYMAAIGVGLWMDWSVVLFAGLFIAYIIRQTIKGRIDRWHLVILIGGIGVAVAGMVTYLVYAGLEGRWTDLWAIFRSRTTETADEIIRRDKASGGGIWIFVRDNLSLPVLILAGGGMVMDLVSHIRRSGIGERVSVSSTAPRDAEGLRHNLDLSQKQSARNGLWILLVTALLWLLIFRRQFVRHNYWMFYTGPMMAVFAARFVLTSWRHFSLSRFSIARVGIGILVIMTLVMEIQGTRDYFSRLSYPPDAPAGWRKIHDATTADERVVLFRNPIRTEQHGHYRFRNIVPPLLAYYLDRPFDVERDFRQVARHSGRQAVFVLPIRDAIHRPAELAWMRGRYAEWLAGPWMVFDLRRPHRAPPSEHDGRR